VKGAYYNFYRCLNIRNNRGESCLYDAGLSGDGAGLSGVGAGLSVNVCFLKKSQLRKGATKRSSHINVCAADLEVEL